MIPTKAPNLPLAPGQYNSHYHEQMNNVLRLYFSRNDANSSALLGPLGTRFLNNPHIAASSNVDQYALGDNTPTLVSWTSVDSNAGFRLDPAGFAVVPVSGTYRITLGLQLVNSDNVIHDTYIWLQVNGTVLENSASRFTTAARKSSTAFAYNRPHAAVVFEAEGGDEVRLWWATDKAATVGGTAGVYLEHQNAQTTPYARPVVPSATGSITLISCPCDMSV